jgi:SET domain-containing protein
MIQSININPKLYVKYIDNIKGFGVFSNAIINKGDIIEDCYSLLIHNTAKDYEPYYFYFRGDTKLLPLGFGCIYNHNDNPNIEWKIIDEDKKIIRFYAINDIDIDDELCHNYGTHYWKNEQYKKLL